jgi:hypothetical protein
MTFEHASVTASLMSRIQEGSQPSIDRVTPHSLRAKGTLLRSLVNETVSRTSIQVWFPEASEEKLVWSEWVTT